MIPKWHAGHLTSVFKIKTTSPKNGLLEHIFSTCTWFKDELLCQAMKPKRFEMAVLLVISEALLGDNGDIQTYDKAPKIMEKVISIFEAEIGLNAYLIWD